MVNSLTCMNIGTSPEKAINSVYQIIRRKPFGRKFEEHKKLSLLKNCLLFVSTSYSVLQHSLAHTAPTTSVKLIENHSQHAQYAFLRNRIPSALPL